MGVDMWSVGTIFCEMVNKRPLFPGDSEIDELYRIFRVLGTPSNENWPGVENLQDYGATFPKWPVRPIASLIKHGNLCPNGLDLLARCLEYDPAKRISAKAAMEHPYFDNLDKASI